jgi:hypothetical protein
MLTPLLKAEIGSPQGRVVMEIDYETTDLKVMGLTYTNPSDRPGSLILSGSLLNRTYFCDANSNLTQPLSGLNVFMEQVEVTDRLGTRIVTRLPGGEAVQFTWPVSGG